MIFYQSGISSDRDAAILKRAGVEHVLVDQFDLSICYPEKFLHVVLDSGAYRAWKRHLNLSVSEYAESVAGLTDFDFVASLDVIGNPEETWRNWEYLRSQGLQVVPIWHYGSPREYLETYLSNAPLVGIGALAGTLRDKGNPARHYVLRDLYEMCQQYPDTFHLFGLNWVKAINELKDGLHSADSSLWLRGARYGISVFRNSRHGKLSQAPGWVMEDWAEKKGIQLPAGRSNLLRSNATEINEYCNTKNPQESKITC